MHHEKGVTEICGQNDFGWITKDVPAIHSHGRGSLCEIACAACASQALDCWDFSQLLGLGWRIVATGYDGDALSKRHHLKAADKNRSSPRPPAVEIFFPQLSVTPVLASF